MSNIHLLILDAGHSEQLHCFLFLWELVTDVTRDQLWQKVRINFGVASGSCPADLNACHVSWGSTKLQSDPGKSRCQSIRGLAQSEHGYGTVREAACSEGHDGEVGIWKWWVRSWLIQYIYIAPIKVIYSEVVPDPLAREQCSSVVKRPVH